MRAVTEYESPHRLLTTQYGVISYRRWCQLESERMNKAGANSFVDTDSGGRIAVVRRDLDDFGDSGTESWVCNIKPDTFVHGPIMTKTEELESEGGDLTCR